MDDGTEKIKAYVEAWSREVADLKAELERCGCQLSEARAAKDAVVSELVAVWEILRGIVDNPGLKAGTMPEQIALDYYVNKAKKGMADPHYMAEAHDAGVREKAFRDCLVQWAKVARTRVERYREKGGDGWFRSAIALEDFACAMETHATGEGREPS